MVFPIFLIASSSLHRVNGKTPAFISNASTPEVFGKLRLIAKPCLCSFSRDAQLKLHSAAAYFSCEATKLLYKFSKHVGSYVLL